MGHRHNLPEDFDIQAILDQCARPINVYDTDLRFIYVNQAYLDATNRTDEIIGQYIFDAFPFTDRPMIRAMFARALKGEVVSTGPVSYAIKHEDGTTSRQYWKAEQNPIRDADGNVICILEMARNVTDEVLLADKKATIAAELDHRVRNLMTVLQSVAAITAHNATDVKSYTADFQNRLAAIARTYHDLAGRDWEGLPIRQMIESELARVADPETGRYTLSGPDISLTVKSSKDASLVLHEMVTNAVKYGCFTRPEGHLNVTWHVDGESFVIEWEETGMTDLQPPSSTGFGSKLIAMMPHMNVEREFRPHGLFLRCSIAVETSINRVEFQDATGS